MHADVEAYEAAIRDALNFRPLAYHDLRLKADYALDALVSLARAASVSGAAGEWQDTVETLLAAATPGPWTWDRESISVDTPDTRALVLMDDRSEPEPAYADARFIAASRELVPLLVNVAKAAEALYEEVEMAESVGGCLPDRVPSLLTGQALAELRSWGESRQ